MLAGIGGGAVYAVASARRSSGSPTGAARGRLTAAGFGAGAALTVVPIRMVIAHPDMRPRSSGSAWCRALRVPDRLALARPLPGEAVAVSSAKVVQSARSFTPAEMLSTPTFWLLYIMFVMISASGLMATAQIALVAKDYGLPNACLVRRLDTHRRR